MFFYRRLGIRTWYWFLLATSLDISKKLWCCIVFVKLDFFSFFAGHRSATIRHFDYTDSDVSDAQDLARLVQLVGAGRLHPEIGLTASWAETAGRIADLRERRIRGKVILIPE